MRSLSQGSFRKMSADSLSGKRQLAFQQMKADTAVIHPRSLNLPSHQFNNLVPGFALSKLSAASSCKHTHGFMGWGSTSSYFLGRFGGTSLGAPCVCHPTPTGESGPLAHRCWVQIGVGGLGPRSTEGRGPQSCRVLICLPFPQFGPFIGRMSSKHILRFAIELQGHLWDSHSTPLT